MHTRLFLLGLMALSIVGAVVAQDEKVDPLAREFLSYSHSLLAVGCLQNAIAILPKHSCRQVAYR